MSIGRPNMSKFRMKIDLSQFYDDERHLAYVLVDSKWDQVSCLEGHVEKVFDVAKVHFLTEDGIFVPSKESVDVIRGSDYLKAFMPQRLRKLRKKRLMNGYDGFGDEALVDEVVGDKRKHNDNGALSCSTPNPPAKKKRRTSMDLTVDAHRASSDGDASHSISGETSSRSNTSLEAVTSTNNSPRAKKPPLKMSKVAEETVKTRRKKRLRKRRRPSADKSDRSSRLSSVPVPISSSTLRLSKSMGTPKGAGKHVHFDESATLVQDNSENGENRVVFRCRLNRDGSLQPREVDTEDSDEVPSPPKKPKIQIHENLLLVEGKDSSTDCDNTSVIEIEDSLLKPSDGRVRNVDSDISNFSACSATVDQILPVSAPLLGLPKTGDIILFKMFRLSEESTSDLSEYICGVVEEVDAEKRKVKCSIIDGLDQIEQTVRKCSQNIGDGKQSGGSCFEFFLDELMDTRIFRMS